MYPNHIERKALHELHLPRLWYCLLCVSSESLLLCVSSESRLLSLLSNCLSAAYRSFLRFLSRRSFSSSSSSPPLATASGSEPSGCSPHFQLPHMSAYFDLYYLLSLLIRLRLPANITFTIPSTSCPKNEGQLRHEAYHACVTLFTVRNTSKTS